jgi:hypothetical protein
MIAVLAAFAFAATGIIAVVAIDITLSRQQAEARCQIGGIAFNASGGRCALHGPN